MMRVRSPIAWSRGVADPSWPRSARSSGTSASTGSCFVVGGSSLRHPLKNWESRRRSFSLLTICVGICLHTSATSCPTAVIVPMTVPVATRFPCPYNPCRTCTANPVSARSLVVYSIPCISGSGLRGRTYVVQFAQCIFLVWVVAATQPA